ncbi:Acetyltransferase (GNAT) family protein [Sanguibacter gelidistatuariae]|uniref:Acetyltransferase (GNAT) family protein n=1 Tax=Sanguibacter gelidistatuariae TaxID=1814289 RepID=A0A1G6RG46_9MICO|nr:GNAT family N-acetyltransferase [Sanguibacter gelidistatuariae]SDD02977.1 Acetyltransferase (GNAT) family protein [Sanguibacter gelidistatuariae]
MNHSVTQAELPGDLGLTWRPLTPQDADALFALIGAIETFDAPPYRTSPGEVAEMLEGDWKDLDADTVAGIDATGELRAYATVEIRPGDVGTIRAFVAGGVHPQARGVGLGAALVAWMTDRARIKLVARSDRGPGRIAAYLEDTAPDHWRLYEGAGYTAQRFYSTLRRDLRVDVHEPILEPGLRLVAWSEDVDDATRLAHNDAFRDHWGSEPATTESWVQGRSTFAPGWSFVVVDDSRSITGELFVAGYLLSGRYEQDWPVAGYSSGYIEMLGVRREYRGRKIAIALLAAVMTAYREDGIEYAELDVDTDNPSGAFGLYSTLGFTKVQGSRMYSIELEQVGPAVQEALARA